MIVDINGRKKCLKTFIRGSSNYSGHNVFKTTRERIPIYILHKLYSLVTGGRTDFEETRVYLNVRKRRKFPVPVLAHDMLTRRAIEEDIYWL